MSFVTLEQETLVVMSELADEEISEIVGGGYDFTSIFKPKTSVENGVKAQNANVTTQVGNAFANGGGDAVVKQDSYSEINNSKNWVKIFGGYGH
ncbi:hypothetical protein NIES2100_67360 [Calothrix sp. NIES-2100]|uniref:hypothetical protein n=1 Tax=Calothrix sp. NIES-2100 TaxID=1954172 RepID=UPI000B6166A3|nr:hypothetical protein NIES2100_67360 [Calothrix sp. NIES-2100]